MGLELDDDLVDLCKLELHAEGLKAGDNVAI